MTYASDKRLGTAGLIDQFVASVSHKHQLEVKWRCGHAAMDVDNRGRTALWHAVPQRASVSHCPLCSSRSTGPYLPGSSTFATARIRLAGRLLPLGREPLSLGARTICSSTLRGRTMGSRAVETFESRLVLDGWSLEALADRSPRDAASRGCN